MYSLICLFVCAYVSFCSSACLCLYVRPSVRPSVCLPGMLSTCRVDEILYSTREFHEKQSLCITRNKTSVAARCKIFIASHSITRHMFIFTYARTLYECMYTIHE